MQNRVETLGETKNDPSHKRTVFLRIWHPRFQGLLLFVGIHLMEQATEFLFNTFHVHRLDSTVCICKVYCLVQRPCHGLYSRVSCGFILFRQLRNEDLEEIFSTLIIHSQTELWLR